MSYLPIFHMQHNGVHSDLDTARRYYELSNDVLSLVRIHCHHKDWAAAEDLVRCLVRRGCGWVRFRSVAVWK